MVRLTLGVLALSSLLLGSVFAQDAAQQVLQEDPVDPPAAYEPRATSPLVLHFQEKATLAKTFNELVSSLSATSTKYDWFNAIRAGRSLLDVDFLDSVNSMILDIPHLNETETELLYDAVVKETVPTSIDALNNLEERIPDISNLSDDNARAVIAFARVNFKMTEGNNYYHTLFVLRKLISGELAENIQESSAALRSRAKDMMWAWWQKAPMPPRSDGVVAPLEDEPWQNALDVEIGDRMVRIKAFVRNTKERVAANETFDGESIFRLIALEDWAADPLPAGVHMHLNKFDDITGRRVIDYLKEYTTLILEGHDILTVSHVATPKRYVGSAPEELAIATYNYHNHIYPKVFGPITSRLSTELKEEAEAVTSTFSRNYREIGAFWEVRKLDAALV